MRRWGAAAAQVVILFGFWLILSDQWRPLFLGMGLAAAVAVTSVTHRIVATVVDPVPGSPAGGPRGLRRLWWMGAYALWMLWRVLLASGGVAYFALHPGLPFRPRFVRFSTELQRPLSRVLLAISINLVPGTLVIRLDGNELLVHTLIPGSADDLASGQSQNMVARAMGEGHQPAPRMHWGPIIEEAVR